MEDEVLITKKPSVLSYEDLRRSFNWEKERQFLDGLPGGGLNIAHEAIVRHAKSELGNCLALRFIGRTGSRDYSYADMDKLSSKFANVLHTLNIQKGDSVFTLLGRQPELYITAFGSLKKGVVFCPMFSVFGPEPVWQRLSRGDGKVVVTTHAFYEKKVREIMPRLPALQYVLITDVERNLNERVLSLPLMMNQAAEQFDTVFTQPNDAALLHFTSGTTGMPKGALHVHNAVLMHYMTGKYVMNFKPGDIFWCTADPGWVTGTSYGIIAPLVHGITNIVDEEEFDAERWYSILEKEKVTIWYTAPTAIRRLMRMNIEPRKKYDLQHLKLIMSVGEPLHAEAVLWGEKMFGMPIRDNWWQTETGGIMIANLPSMKVKPGSMGKPLPGIEAGIAIIDENSFRQSNKADEKGHLVIKKGWPSMFISYLHDDERYQKAFHEDWYITGDLAKKDEEGYYWFVGRADDIIKTSGHMVGPFEVETVLMDHEAVAEAAVIGKPDPLIGEIVKAFVVLKSGYVADENLKQDITGYARKKLGAAVAPKELKFVTELPKTRSGKILRRLLKARELGLPEGDLSTLEKP